METFQIILIGSAILPVVFVITVMVLARRISTSKKIEEERSTKLLNTMKRTIEVQDEALDIYREMNS